MMKIVISLIIQEGLILISKRPKGVHLARFWEFPGGKTQAEESPEEALERECKEELGVKIIVLKAFDNYEWNYDGLALDMQFYRCQIVEGLPRSLASDELKWVKLSEIMNYSFPPANKRVLEKLLSISWTK